MDIRADIERVRNLNYTLQNWESIVKAEKSIAIYGRGFDYFDIKVKSTPKNDRMEKAILNAMESEHHWQKLFDLYWKERTAAVKLIERYSNANDQTILHRYLTGCSLSEIPLKGKQKNPQNIVNSAIKRLQIAIDRDKAAKRAEAVQRLVDGEKGKCKFCNGSISYRGEESKKLVFVCEGCGKKFKTDKLIS